MSATHHRTNSSSTRASVAVFISYYNTARLSSAILFFAARVYIAVRQYDIINCVTVQICTNALGVQICTNVLDVQICTNALGVQICTNVLDVQICTNVAGMQICTIELDCDYTTGKIIIVLCIYRFLSSRSTLLSTCRCTLTTVDHQASQLWLW